jgi:hypothetical protein
VEITVLVPEACADPRLMPSISPGHGQELGQASQAAATTTRATRSSERTFFTIFKAGATVTGAPASPSNQGKPEQQRAHYVGRA